MLVQKVVLLNRFHCIIKWVATNVGDCCSCIITMVRSDGFTAAAATCMICNNICIV